MATEKRLIYTGELKEMLADMEATGGHKYYRQGANCILHEIMPQIIDDCPTVDAVEVVHGRWDKNWSGDNIVYCNQCYMAQDMPTPYCHSCGAKMDGDGNG